MSVNHIAFIAAVIIPLATIFYVILWMNRKMKKTK